jgi:DNA-binding MarR family transcriptional regulator
LGKRKIDDVVDSLARRWGEKLPDVDASLMPLFGRLGMLSKLLEAFHRHALLPVGVTFPEYQLLTALYTQGRGGEMLPKELTRLLGQTAAGVTKTLDRLEQRHWIVRRPHAQDRRSVSVRLTAAGRQAATEVCRAETKAQQEALGHLPAVERERIHRVLCGLIDALRSTSKGARRASH